MTKDGLYSVKFKDKLAHLHSHIHDAPAVHSEIPMAVTIRNDIKTEHKETGCESVKRISLQEEWWNCCKRGNESYGFINAGSSMTT
jgi:hypothetical protein